MCLRVASDAIVKFEVVFPIIVDLIIDIFFVQQDFYTWISLSMRVGEDDLMFTC